MAFERMLVLLMTEEFKWLAETILIPLLLAFLILLLNQVQNRKIKQLETELEKLKPYEQDLHARILGACVDTAQAAARFCAHHELEFYDLIGADDRKVSLESLMECLAALSIVADEETFFTASRLVIHAQNILQAVLDRDESELKIHATHYVEAMQEFIDHVRESREIPALSTRLLATLNDLPTSVIDAEHDAEQD